MLPIMHGNDLAMLWIRVLSHKNITHNKNLKSFYPMAVQLSNESFAAIGQKNLNYWPWEMRL